MWVHLKLYVLNKVGNFPTFPLCRERLTLYFAVSYLLSNVFFFQNTQINHFY